MSKPTLFMTHVSYAGGLRGSARQFDCGFMYADDIKERGIDFRRFPTGSSLLANSFNDAWCTALNLRESGMDIRWFVMMHDDIIPSDGWVKTLIDDLESSGADLVSAVVPLKDFSGTTSSAIDRAEADAYDGGHWEVERRLTLTEAHKMPPVFTAADCGYPDRHLLANTGCWVCRFDRPWVSETDENGNAKLFFTINDRIRRDPQNGKWRSYVEPEDWFFSRRMQMVGGKVCLTTRVKLNHYGMTPYPNYPNAQGECYGGVPYDYAHGDRIGYKPIFEAKSTENKAYESQELADVQGWLNDDEGRLLAKYAKGQRVLEIGSYCGRSTIWMAREAEHVTAVDTFDTGGTGVDTLQLFLTNIERYGLSEKVDYVVGTIQKAKAANSGTTEGLRWFNPEFCNFGMIFIDAGHSFEQVTADIEESLPLLAPGGLLALHDYDRPSDPGVTEAVDLFIQNGAEVVDRAGTVIILKVNHERQTISTAEAPPAIATEYVPSTEFAATCSW